MVVVPMSTPDPHQGQRSAVEWRDRDRRQGGRESRRTVEPAGICLERSVVPCRCRLRCRRDEEMVPIQR